SSPLDTLHRRKRLCFHLAVRTQGNRAAAMTTFDPFSVARCRNDPMLGAVGQSVNDGRAGSSRPHAKLGPAVTSDTSQRSAARLTIGQLAKQAGVSRSMLRYYEEQGLLKPVGRTPAGYRLYAPHSAQTLLFIQRAQRLGFSLADIQLFLDRLRQGALLDETVAAVAEQRYLAIERQLTELLVLRHEMGVFLLDLAAQGHDGRPADLYQRLVAQVCGHSHGHSPPRSTLAWLLDRTGCSLANLEREDLLNVLRGKHIHVWRDGDAYRVLIPGASPELEN